MSDFPSYRLDAQQVMIDKAAIVVSIKCSDLKASHDAQWLNENLKHSSLMEPEDEPVKLKKKRKRRWNTYYHFESESGFGERSNVKFDYFNQKLTAYLEFNGNKLFRAEFEKQGVLDKSVGLDGKSNFNPPRLRSIYSGEELQQIHFQVLNDKIGDICRAVNKGIYGEYWDGPSCRADYWLQDIEIYQDFNSSNSTEEVLQIIPRCGSAFRKFEVFEYPTWKSKLTVDGNCYAILLHNGNHQIIKFYGKTHNLLRIEVYYGKFRLRKIIGKGKHGHGGNFLTGMSHEPWRSITTPLVEETNLHLSKLDHPIPAQTEEYVNLTFPHWELMEACKSREDYEFIRYHLLNRGAIATTGLSKDQQGVLRHLRKMGILEKPEERFYRLVSIEPTDNTAVKQVAS